MSGKVNELSEHKELLIGEIAVTTDWRAEKAQEYPEDTRNEQSATALSALVNNLSGLASADPLLERIYEIERGMLDRSPEPGKDERALKFVQTLAVEKSEFFRRYGFDDPAEDGTDVAAFLSALADLTQQCADGLTNSGDPEIAA